MAEKEQNSNIVGFGGNAIGGIASAAGGVISTGLNAFFTSRENRKNREWTEQQNNLAWHRQRQLIDEQRAYDTPKAQMQRLMEAGLNPNLIYGGVDQSPMAAQSAPNAAGKYAGVAPQVDPYVSSEISKNMAEVRKLDNESKLSVAQAKRLYKITDAEYGKLTADADFIRQKIRSSEFETKVNEYRSWAFDQDDEFDYFDAYGNKTSQSLKDMIIQNDINKLVSSSSDYRKAVALFETEVGLRKATKHKIELENKDLQSFVDVCARIYEGQASQADYIKSVSELNQKFYGTIGASNDVVKLVFSFLSMIVSGVSNFTPSKRN